MFPMQITMNVTNADQLRAIAAIAGDVKVAESAAGRTTKATDTCANHKPADTKAETAKKSDAVTANAGTQTTAATSDVQEKKAESSVESKLAAMTADERSAKVKAAIAKSGRDKVVALLQKYNAAKASEVAADKLPAFDDELCALA